MARARSVHRCRDCGESSPRWVGRCPGCGEWNTLIEERLPEGPAGRVTIGAGPAEPAVPIVDLDGIDAGAVPTGLSELDRVLSGGLVPGSVTLVGGEPGIGKSTLLLHVASARANRGEPVLYVSAEESRQQVRLRAERLRAQVPGLWLAADTSIADIVAQIDAVEPALVIVDSIQTVYDADLSSAPGSVAQVRECAHRLVQEAKRRGLAIVLVGHVTKEGSLAGPRVLEHVVDTVLAFEGDRHHGLRLLRAVKHRFGATSELGLFEMTDEGLAEVPDASGLFLADRRAGVPGSVVVPTVDGHRPLLVELQALVALSPLATPRRSAQGVDAGRLNLLLAVLAQRVGLGPAAGDLSLGRSDVYALAVGGVRVSEPGADLALALAVASSYTGVPVAADLVACGEVGLGGELRQVGQTPRRLAEAARLGFRRALVPALAPDPPPGIEVIRAATLADAIVAAGLVPADPPTSRPADGSAPSSRRTPFPAESSEAVAGETSSSNPPHLTPVR